MKNKEQKKAFLMRIPVRLHQKLREYAFYSGQTMADVVCQSLLDWKLEEKAQALTRSEKRRG